MAQISVEVDLDDFDNDEIITEIVYRINLRTGRRVLSEDQVRQLKLSLVGVPLADMGVKLKTLEDEIKNEHIMKVWNSYTSEEMETLLPEKR